MLCVETNIDVNIWVLISQATHTTSQKTINRKLCYCFPSGGQYTDDDISIHGRDKNDFKQKSISSAKFIKKDVT